MKPKARRKLYHILEDADYGHWIGKLDRVLLSVLIFLDISAFILETSPSLNQNYYWLFWLFRNISIFSTVVFTVEYGLRIWLCTVERRFSHPLWGRLRYALTPMAIVDFISTFPFYLLLLFHHLAFLKNFEIAQVSEDSEDW